jgi:hypothetical protein
MPSSKTQIWDKNKFVDRDMINPYEVTTAFSTTPRRPWRYVIVFLAGVVGYCTLFAALGLTSWLSYGWPAPFNCLVRVVRIHRELSLNTVAAFTPNLALAIFVSIATTKLIDSHNSQSRWWMLACITVIGFVVVLRSTAHWNLIPWTWPSELSNAARSALTLLFPIVAYIVARLRERRTKR